ncbi:MAG: hypothetical protein QXE05_09195 [Nitrososphaeria archaeon]
MPLEEALEAMSKGFFGVIMGYKEMMLEVVFEMLEHRPTIQSMGFIFLISCNFFAAVLGSMKSGLMCIIGFLIGGIIIKSLNIVIPALCSIIGLEMGIWLKNR